MPDFSTILQTPEIRSLVQEKFLERRFFDALFPALLFRAEAAPEKWPEGSGDDIIMSGDGLLDVDLTPIQPGVDPLPASYAKEQWTAQKQLYGKPIDTHMPSSVAALASLLMRDTKKIALNAASALNRMVRNRMYNAALSGQTCATGVQSTTTSLLVARLNGFTRARNPNLAQGAPVRFDPVSVNNPLTVTILDSGSGAVTRKVTGFTPTNAGDETGPGTLTLDSSVSVADRAYVLATDMSNIIRVGGGNSVDSIGTSDVLTLGAIRDAVARLQQMEVPTHGDGRYHSHLDPTSINEIYADAEWGRLLTGVPDYYAYKAFTLGEMLDCIFLRDTQCPQPTNVNGAGSSFATQKFATTEGLAAEVFNASSVQVHRPIFTGQGGIMEYYEDFDNMVTEAGLQGAKMISRTQNNGIEIMADRTWMFIRSPQNRLQDMVSLIWKFAGDWPCRTDATTGDTARFKRFVTVEHG